MRLLNSLIVLIESQISKRVFFFNSTFLHVHVWTEEQEGLISGFYGTKKL